MLRKPSYPRSPHYTTEEKNALTFKRVGKKFYKTSAWTIPTNQKHKEFEGINLKSIPTDGNELINLINELNTRVKDVKIILDVEHYCCDGNKWSCECEYSMHFYVSGSVEVEQDDEFSELYDIAIAKKTAYDEKLKEYQEKKKAYDQEKSKQAAKKRQDAEYKNFLRLKKKFEGNE